MSVPILRSWMIVALFVTGFILFLITQNVLYGLLFGAPDNFLYILGMALSVLTLVGSVVFRIFRLTLPGIRKTVDLRILIAQLVALLGLLLYVLEGNTTIAKWFIGVDNPEGIQDWRDFLTMGFFLFIISGGLYLLFIEIAYGSLDHLEKPDMDRLNYAGRSSLIITLVLANFGLLNYLVGPRDWDIELVNTKGISKPSDETMGLLDFIPPDATLEIKLFYPNGSETRRFLDNYFKSLDVASDQVDVVNLDADLQPEEAEAYKLTGNGTIVLVNGEMNGQIRIPENIRSAVSQLQKLDDSVFEEVSKIILPSKIAYLTKGHEELSDSTVDRTIGLAPLALVKTLLEYRNFETKDLTYEQGLGNDIPEDCDILVIAAPNRNFTESAMGAINRYLDRGGRLLLVLDPFQRGDMKPILERLNLVYRRDLLYNENPTSNLGKSNLIPGIGFSSHESVQLFKSQKGSWIAALLTGSLGKASLKEGSATVDFIVDSPNETWIDLPKSSPVPSIEKDEKANTDNVTKDKSNDPTDAKGEDTTLQNETYSEQDILEAIQSGKTKNNDGIFDAQAEKKSVYHLAAAVSRTIEADHPAKKDNAVPKKDSTAKATDATHPSHKDEEHKEGETDKDSTAPEPQEMRAIVLASKYLAATPRLNEAFVLGLMDWLNPKPTSVGKSMPVPPPKDKPVFQSTQEQRAVFWTSILVLPFVVLVTGFVLYGYRIRRYSNAKQM